MEKPMVTPAQAEILEKWASVDSFLTLAHLLEEAREHTVSFCPDCGVPVWLSRMADYGKGAEDEGKLYVAAWEMAGDIGGDGWLECETCFGK